MPLRKYKGLSLRNKIFWGFLIICGLSVSASAVLSYFILRDNALQQSSTEQQNKADVVMASLDYAVSHSEVETGDLPQILGNKIYEIADISKHDLVIYDLNGNFIMSNKDPNLISQKKIELPILNRVLAGEQRVDVATFDTNLDANVVSSYILLKNNMLEPIAVVYFPYYHSDSAYLDVFNRYLKYIILINLFIVGFSVLLSWIISNNVTNALRKFSELIARMSLFDTGMRPIKYYHNDELSSLVKSYNNLILKIQDQKERLTFTEKEHAWREMAKQVAHEVKNPLTPMKLTIQNFERRFDPEDPNIRNKVKTMSATVIDQIDIIAAVASAFSQFAQLPEKNNETFDLKQEIEGIVQLFSGDRIFIHSNRKEIQVNMDKIYLNRIITNLITNAKQAESPDRPLIINVDMEQIQKKIKISIEDNGIGIPTEMWERIFEPNFTSKNSGMGLGLSMVRKMVEDYKGTIAVDSEVGKGTTFTILIPTNM